jgi:hypothetical protein
MVWWQGNHLGMTTSVSSLNHEQYHHQLEQCCLSPISHPLYCGAN